MMPTTKSRFIFIYGTLMRHLRGNLFFDFEKHLRFISDAYYRGMLFEIRNYPGVIPSADKNDKVHGELYEILNFDYVENILDEYEGCGKSFAGQEEYHRKLVYVNLDHHKRKRCWIYLYNRPVHHYTRIPDGDYRRFRQHQFSEKV